VDAASAALRCAVVVELRCSTCWKAGRAEKNGGRGPPERRGMEGPRRDKRLWRAGLVACCDVDGLRSVMSAVVGGRERQRTEQR
jgi:hypothetical protein